MPGRSPSRAARAVLFTTLSLTVVSCGDRPQSEGKPISATTEAQTRELVERAQAVIRGGVGLDPKATQFRNVYSVEGGAVCGEVNWQDLSGKYRGFVPFMYRYGIGVIDSEMFRSAKFAETWSQICEGRIVVSGSRVALPEHVKEDFAQRLNKLKAANGIEKPASYGNKYWEQIAQIAEDLDNSRASALAAKAAKDNAESAEFADKARQQIKR